MGGGRRQQVMNRRRSALLKQQNFVCASQLVKRGDAADPNFRRRDKKRRSFAFLAPANRRARAHTLALHKQ